MLSVLTFDVGRLKISLYYLNISLLAEKGAVLGCFQAYLPLKADIRAIAYLLSALTFNVERPDI